MVRGSLEWKRCLALALTAALLCSAGCKEQGEPEEPEEPSSPPVCESLDRSQPSVAQPGLCSGEWCWVNAQLQGYNFYNVWSPSPGVAWLISDRGLVFRIEGTRIELMPTPSQAELVDVWGSSDQDVWVVGRQSTLLHWDGHQWSTVPGPMRGDLLAVWGTSATSVWAGDDRGMLIHWDGTAWSQVALDTTAAITDLWAADPEEVWVLTQAGVRRCEPSGCQPFAGPDGPTAGFAPKRVRGFAKDDVYFLDERQSGRTSPYVHRWHAGSWEQIENHSENVVGTHALEVVSPDLVIASTVEVYPFPPSFRYYFFLKSYRAPTVLGAMPLDTEIYGLWFSAPDDGWAVGRNGLILRNDAQGWRPWSLASTALHFPPDYELEHVPEKPFAAGDLVELPSGGVGVTELSSRLWRSAEGNIWRAKASRTELTITRSTTVPLESRFSRDLGEADARVGIHGSSESNIWVAETSGLYRYDGSAWIQKVSLAPDTSELTGPVWAFSNRNVWAGGTHGLFHWNGKSLARVELPGFTVAGLWGSWAKDLWAVGSREGTPSAYHWDGEQWTEVPVPPVEGLTRLEAITGRCSNEVYAVGSRAVFRWDGAAWHAIPTPVPLGAVTAAARVGAELWVANGTEFLRHPW